MADPTITYGHKFTGDFYALTETHEGTAQTWTEGNLSDVAAGEITESILHGDILQIELVTNDGVGTLEEGAYTNNVNLGIDTTLFPSFLVRYKTSASSAGAQAKVILEFNDATTQTIMAGSYSTTGATAIGTLTPAKTLDHISMYATAPVGTADATYYVYYDFVLIHEGTFTFPHVAPKGARLRFPYKRAKLDIWGRDGGILQKGGMDTPRIEMGGTMEHGQTWGGSRLTYGEYLLKILRGMKGDYREPWNWLTIGDFGFKVIPAPEGLDFGLIPGNEAQVDWNMNFEVHSLSSLGEADWDNLEWAGIE